MSSTVESSSPFIHYVSRNDPPYMFHCGERFETHTLPPGTRVIYPKPPLPGVKDRCAAIRQAIDTPMGCEPLSELLKPGMKITIAFDDISLPLPPMQRPDIRQQIMEILVERYQAHQQIQYSNGRSSSA